MMESIWITIGKAIELIFKKLIYYLVTIFVRFSDNGTNMKNSGFLNLITKTKATL